MFQGKFLINDEISEFFYADAYSKNDSITKLFYLSMLIKKNIVRDFMSRYRKNRLYIDIGYSRYPVFQNSHDIFTHYSKDDYVHIIVKVKDSEEIGLNDIIANAFYDNGHAFKNNFINTYFENGTPESLIDHVYEAIMCHTSIPVLPEWKSFIVDKLLQSNSRIHESTLDVSPENDILQIDHGFDRACQIRFTKANVLQIIQNGLSNKEISIEGCNNASSELTAVQGLQNYLTTFGQALANKVSEVFKPKFDSKVHQLDPYINDLFEIAQYYDEDIKPYSMQKNVIEGLTRHLKKNKFTMISAEPGAGKSIMAINTVLNACRFKKGFTTMIMCPTAALCLHWQREINRIAPDSDVVIVESIQQLFNLIPKIKDKKKKKPLWLVFSNGTLKSSYETRPSVIWSKKKKSFVCPQCGEKLLLVHKKNRFGTPLHNYQPESKFFDDFDLLEMDNKDLVCPKCYNHLWTAATRNNSKLWIKIPKAGWILKPRIEIVKEACQYYLTGADPRMSARQKTKYQNISKAIDSYQNNGLVERFPNRYPIAKFIKKHLKGAFDFAICDEVHELAGDTLQGHAFGDIVCAAKKVIALTGTLSNGYAGGLFHLLFRVDTRHMIEMGYGYEDKTKFEKDYGVVQENEIWNGRFSTLPHSADSFLKSRAQSKSTKAIAGISPLLPSEFLLSNTVFLQQKHIRHDLCAYREIPMGIDMDEDLAAGYQRLVDYQRAEFLRMNAEARSGSREFRQRDRQAMRNSLMKIAMFADQPFGIDVACGVNQDGTTQYLELDDEVIRNKEKALLELLQSKKEAGEKALIYVEFTGRLVIQERLQEYLEANGIHTTVMTTKLKASQREIWLNKKAKEGYDAVILNPRLVDKGLNLLDYTTIIFYEVGTRLFTIRQASQRSRRINQEHPVEVYFFYYKNTIQQNILGLISQKLKASVAIEGAFSENGLAQFTDDTDILTAIANSFANNEDIVIESENFEETKVADDTVKDDGSAAGIFGIHFKSGNLQYYPSTLLQSYNLYAVA